MSRGQIGRVEISWIAESKEYDFRVYGASQPDAALDSMKVRRGVDSLQTVLRQLTIEVKHGNIDVTELSRFIATAMPRCLYGAEFHDIFARWERHGFHVTPVHFYQPIPNTQSLPESLWNRPSSWSAST